MNDHLDPLPLMENESPAPTPALPKLPLRSQEEMRVLDPLDASWLWQGFLGPQNITLLTSQWKSGKTTLVSVLLSKLHSHTEFLGLPIRPARSIVISEESDVHWADRVDRLDFGHHVRWLCRPFSGQPNIEQWRFLIRQLEVEHRDNPFDLLVIDPLASFLPTNCENLASSMLGALLPLQSLTNRGVAILVLHHPRKGEPPPGQAARGSGALSGHVDILMEMNWCGRAFEDDRRRRLSSWSRHTRTPRRMVIELNAEGTDYRMLGDFVESPINNDPHWKVLIGVLEDADGKISRRAILDAWPADFVKPKGTALWDRLDKAVKEGSILCDGTGHRNSPFRYWLPGMEEIWKHDPWRLPDLKPLRDDWTTLRELLMEKRRREMMKQATV